MGPLLHGAADHVGEPAGGSGIVESGVEAAEPVDGRRYRRLDAGGVGYIRPQEYRRSACSLDLPHRFMAFVLVDIGDRNLRTLSRKT
jgi:hypothetical protein